MQNLQPPSKFSFKPEEWSAWIKQFRRYYEGLPASWLQRRAKSNVTHTHTHNVIGEESEQIFETFHFGTVVVGAGERAREVSEWDTDFETLVSKFDSNFLVKRNIHERTKFQERKQHDSETTEEYYRSVRALVAHCEYIDTEDQVREDLL